MAAEQFYASRSQTTTEANQKLFPSKEEAKEIKSNSEVVLACRGKDKESSSVWISQTFTAELNECCWAAVSMGYQAVTEQHILSPPYLVSWLYNAQWLLFFPSSPTAFHTQHVIQRQKQHKSNKTSRAWTLCSAAPLCFLLLTFVSLHVQVRIWNLSTFT